MSLPRPSLPSAIRTLRLTQRRYARVQDVRFLATHGDQRKVLEKYKEKLSEKAKKEGLASVNELREVYASKIQEQRKMASTIAPQSPFPPAPPPPLTPPTTPLAAFPGAVKQKSSARPGIKPLSSYLDLEKVAPLPEREVSALWRLRHTSPSSLVATIDSSMYKTMQNTAQKHPSFILPLPRDNDPPNPPATEIHYIQFSFPTQTQHTLLMTSLAEYKLKGAYATPHTTITHHLDLKDSHGIVLLNGEVGENRGVTVEEARWLLLCLQRFYADVGPKETGEREKRRRLVETFAKGSGDFKLEELIEEAEKIV